MGAQRLWFDLTAGPCGLPKLAPRITHRRHCFAFFVGRGAWSSHFSLTFDDVPQRSPGGSTLVLALWQHPKHEQGEHPTCGTHLSHHSLQHASLIY